MFDLILGWAVIFFPIALAVVFIFVPARSENQSAHMKWRIGLVVFGILFSLLALLQQSRTQRAAAEDRESAIRETSARVATETADRVTKAMTAQYEGTISTLNRQIGGLQSELNRGSAENAKTVTGGDSLCWIMFSPGQGILTAVQRGNYPLRGVTARMTDLEKAKEILSNQPITVDNVFAADRNFQIGDMPVHGSHLLDTHYLLSGDKHSFNIFFSGLNGFWTQELRLRRVNGEWTQATRVSRSVTDRTGKSYEKFEFQQIDKNFPKSNSGQPEWN